MNKKHGMTGKRNALKLDSEKLSQAPSIRVTGLRDLPRYRVLAKAARMSLAAWVREAMSEKADREEG